MKIYLAKETHNVRKDDGVEEKRSGAFAEETKSSMAAERGNPVVDGQFESRNEREPTLP